MYHLCWRELEKDEDGYVTVPENYRMVYSVVNQDESDHYGNYKDLAEKL